MQSAIISSPIFSLADRELVEFVKKATCAHFDITEERLLNDSSPVVAHVRFLCFWLIIRNTQLKPSGIAQAFGKSRTAVLNGLDTIEVHKNIYRQTIDNLRSIAALANNFEKNYSWHILPISTKH